MDVAAALSLLNQSGQDGANANGEEEEEEIEKKEAEKEGKRMATNAYSRRVAVADQHQSVDHYALLTRDKKGLYSELLRLLEEHCEKRIAALQERTSTPSCLLSKREVEQAYNMFRGKTQMDVQGFLLEQLKNMSSYLSARTAKKKGANDLQLHGKVMSRYRDKIRERISSFIGFDVTGGITITRKKRNMHKTKVEYSSFFNDTSSLQKFEQLKQFEKDLQARYSDYMHTAKL